MNHETNTGNPRHAAAGGRNSAPKRPVAWLGIRQVTGLLLLLATLPAWSAGLQLPSVHRLGTATPVPPPPPRPARPDIYAHYQLAPSCTNLLHAISVVVRIGEAGGGLKAGQARIKISAQHPHVPAIWRASGAGSKIPALEHGKSYATQQWIGVLPADRKALPGRHYFLVELVGQNTYRRGPQKPLASRILPVYIPAGYCQRTLRPATNGLVMGKRAISSALNPDLHVVSVKVAPDRSVTGTPILVTAFIQNKGALASKAGEKLHIYCNAYEGPNTPPVKWTCKAPAPHTSAGGMPMWDIPLPAIPGHGQADVALRIQEHWTQGLYYFTHTKPGKAATVQDLVKAKTDSIIQIDPK